MSLKDLDLQERVGDHSGNIGAASTVVLRYAKARTSVIFVNDSDETIYLAFGLTAVSGQGIRLNASGGAYEISKTCPWEGAVNAICASGSKNLCVVEVCSNYD